MKKTLTFSKKILLVLCLAVSMFFVNAFALLTTITAGAVSSYYGTNTVEVKNGDFDDFTSDNKGLPYEVDTGWKGIEDLSSTTVNAGIIDVGDAFYNTTNNKFGLQENPETDSDIVNADTSILMIKAKSSETRYGYVSDEMTLSAGKFYVIKVHCKTGLKLDDETVVDNATASIYTSLSKESSDNFVNIDTNGNWKTYNIFVATDSFNSSTLKIELRLGNQTASSNGVVFFDKVEVLEVANIDYFSTTVDSQNIVINLDNDYTASKNFQNNDFEGDESYWTVSENNDGTKSNAGIFSTATINQFIKDNYDVSQNEDFANTFVANNEKQLFISNFENTSTTITSSENNNLTINQFGFYYLSMLVKTGNLSGDGINVTLTEVVEDGKTAVSTSQSGITSSSDGLKQYNDFKKVEFYIRGNAWQDKQVSISFSLGSTDKEITGWAIIDDIKLQQINQTEFNKKTSTTEFDLSKNIKNTDTILNGSFDFNTNTSSTISYPTAPLNWTYSEKENTESGIIRVRTEYFNNDATSYGLAPSQNPGPNTSYESLQGILISADTTYENVLMIRNTTTNDVSYSSDSFSLTANTSATTESTYVKIEVAIKTLNDSKAFVQVVTKDGKLIANINDISATDWTNYTIFIKNGISSQDVQLVLGSEGNGNNNYSFFDYVKYSSVTDITLADIQKTNNSTFVDLAEDSFYSHSNKVVRENVYESPNYSVYGYEESKSSAVYNGVTDTALNNSLKTRTDANDSNVFVITNTVASYQHLISNYTYKLMKGSYYEISVWVKTDFTNCEHEDDYGAYIELVTLDEDGEVVVNEKNKIKFVNFSTSTEENNGWVKYTMYVLAEEEDQNAKILLGLGNQENLTKGTVYFDDLKVIDISESEYSNKKANDTTLISKVIPVVKDDSSNANGTSNSESSTPNEMNVFALLSSIILVIALALAIAGYLIRRIPKKKITAKIKKSNYDKAPTSIDENEVKRELKANREQKLDEINKKLVELKAEKEKLQKEYEEKVNKEESQGEKEKLYTAHTKKVNKLNKEIDYLSSAVTYVSDETNVRISELKEIKKRKKEVEQEFLKMKAEEVAKEEENADESSSKPNNKK